MNKRYITEVMHFGNTFSSPLECPFTNLVCALIPYIYKKGSDAILSLKGVKTKDPNLWLLKMHIDLLNCATENPIQQTMWRGFHFDEHCLRTRSLMSANIFDKIFNVNKRASFVSMYLISELLFRAAFSISNIALPSNFVCYYL